jgi:hypothetical protein
VEAVFGPGGIWRELLGRAEGYAGTENWCESSTERRYRVRDFWWSHREFDAFRARFWAEFERFEEWIRSVRLIEKEQFLGAYYEKFEDGSDDDLVLS